MEKKYFLIKFSTPYREIDTIRPLLAERITWGWEEEEKETEIEFKIYFASKEAAKDMLSSLSPLYPYISFKAEEINTKDWAIEWKKIFVPIEVEETFSIVPPWLSSLVNHKKDKIILIIYPQMAFGTGHHPTTRLCLKALVELKKNNLIEKEERFLDLGTGSGILAIACVKLGFKGIGVDIDPLVRENLITNMRLNSIGDSFLPIIGPLSCIKKQGKFHLIIANILLNPLKEMAQEVVSFLEDRGILILSGILKEQEKDLIGAYSPLLGHPLSRLYMENWTCLIWKRNN